MDKREVGLEWLAKTIKCLQCKGRSKCTIEEAFSEYCLLVGAKGVTFSDGTEWKPTQKVSNLFRNMQVQ